MFLPEAGESVNDPLGEEGAEHRWLGGRRRWRSCADPVDYAPDDCRRHACLVLVEEPRHIEALRKQKLKQVEVLVK